MEHQFLKSEYELVQVKILECEHTLESMGYLDEINSADNLRRIVQRLPCHFRTVFSNLVRDQT